MRDMRKNFIFKRNVLWNLKVLKNNRRIIPHSLIKFYVRCKAVKNGGGYLQYNNKMYELYRPIKGNGRSFIILTGFHKELQRRKYLLGKSAFSVGC